MDDGNLGLPLPLIVDVDAPGLESREIPMALRAPDKQWTLFFDDVEVPADRLIGGETGGLGALFDGLNPERIMGASISCGAGRRALEKGAAYAREREVWDQPIGAHQGIAHPLAEAKIELELASLMTQKAAALYDAGAKAGEASNMAKYSAAEAAISAWTARSRPTAATASRSSTAWPTCGGASASAGPPGLARDDPQLRGRALARPAEDLLGKAQLVDDTLGLARGRVDGDHQGSPSTSSTVSSISYPGRIANTWMPSV